MTPEAQKILTMIEGVTPETPVAVLDEIDVRTYALRNGKTFLSGYTETTFDYHFHLNDAPIGIILEDDMNFTRSIDAQEALRREGWAVEFVGMKLTRPPYWVCELASTEDRGKTVRKSGATEPLARLHAWVQVWGME